MESFGNRLSELISAQGKSQQEFARLLGYSKSTVSKWINNKALPDLETFKKICILLSCPADALLDIEASNEFEYEGIKWSEQLPSYGSTEQLNDVKLGILLFRKLVCESAYLGDIRKITSFHSSDITHLYAAFKLAIHSGALRINSIQRNTQLEKDLKARFPELHEAIVAQIPSPNDGTLIRAEFVAFLAATEAFRKLENPRAVALGSGYTLLRMAEQTVSRIGQFSGTVWVPLTSFPRDEFSSLAANYIALTLANRHWDSKALHLPFMTKGAPDDLQRLYEDVIFEFRNAVVAFITVNGPGRRSRTGAVHQMQLRSADSHEFARLEVIYDLLAQKGLADKFAWECLGQLLDEDGQPVGDDTIKARNKELIFQIDPRMLRQIAFSGRVWLVAARLYKARPVLMAIRNGVANALVIDNEIATYLLENEVN